MISEFDQWLRSRTHQEKRPFQQETVVAYAKAARALDAWIRPPALHQVALRPPRSSQKAGVSGTQNMRFWECAERDAGLAAPV